METTFYMASSMEQLPNLFRNLAGYESRPGPGLRTFIPDFCAYFVFLMPLTLNLNDLGLLF
jgi:hypothetical protein